LHVRQEDVQRDSLPLRAELRPLGDTVQVDGRCPGGQGHELIPVPRVFGPRLRADGELPGVVRHHGGGAGGENGEAGGLVLPRRECVPGVPSPAVEPAGNDGHVGPPSAERAASIFQQMVRRSISAGGNAGTYPCRPSNHGRTGRYRTGLQRSLTGVRCPRPLWSVTSVATTTRAHCTGQKGVHMLRKQGTTILGATALVLAGVVGGAAPAQAAPVQITAGGTAPACIQRSVVNNPDGGMQAWL